METESKKGMDSDRAIGGLKFSRSMDVCSIRRAIRRARFQVLKRGANGGNRNYRIVRLSVSRFKVIQFRSFMRLGVLYSRQFVIRARNEVRKAGCVTTSCPNEIDNPTSTG